LFLDKSNPDGNGKVIIRSPSDARSVDKILEAPIHKCAQREWINDQLQRFETRLVGRAGALVKRIKMEMCPLQDFCRLSLGCQAYNKSKHTKKQIKEKAFHAENRISDEYLPELAGSDVARYSMDKTNGLANRPSNTNKGNTRASATQDFGNLC